MNWQLLAKSTDGIVIYMGLHNLSYIVSKLLLAGSSPDTPAAVIQQATVIGQRCLKTSLDQLVKEVEIQKFISPSIVIIGETVNFQIPFSAPPLANVTMPISF